MDLVRHAVAVPASGERTAQLRSIKAPKLVFYREGMCDVRVGAVTAEANQGQSGS